MKISVEWFQGAHPSFNVSLSSAEGKDAFLVVKGCRIAVSGKGPFVSWPSRKIKEGEYWNHCWGSDAFNAAVLAEAQRTKPQADTRMHGERKRGDDDDSVPF